MAYVVCRLFQSTRVKRHSNLSSVAINSFFTLDLKPRNVVKVIFAVLCMTHFVLSYFYDFSFFRQKGSFIPFNARLGMQVGNFGGMPGTRYERVRKLKGSF